MAEADLHHFSELREKYIRDIAENLGEAHALMIKLNSNLQLWTKGTGELDHLAAVWGAFQNRLACLSAVLGDIEENRQQNDTETMSDPPTPTNSESQVGAKDC